MFGLIISLNITCDVTFRIGDGATWGPVGRHLSICRWNTLEHLSPVNLSGIEEPPVVLPKSWGLELLWTLRAFSSSLSSPCLWSFLSTNTFWGNWLTANGGWSWYRGRCYNGVQTRPCFSSKTLTTMPFWVSDGNIFMSLLSNHKQIILLFKLILKYIFLL